ncbi:MAG: lcfB 7 [Nocardioidaceae bacterium]|nr:lcfB 7 [Nocardioidaceae bacterium]
MSLPALVDQAAERWPDKRAWTFPDTEPVTFAEIAERSAAYAATLAARGVVPGDRVGLMLRNRLEFALLWLAVARLGAAVVPLNVKYGPTDAGHLLTETDPRLVVAETDLLDLVERARPGTAAVAVDDLPLTDGFVQQPVDADTVVNVQFTSGTSGTPKGCLLPHRYWTTLADSLVDGFPHLTAHDVMLTAQPVSYVDPQWNLVASLTSGAELVVLDGFHPSTFFDEVRRHQVTYFYCLAAMPTLLLAMPASDLDHQHRLRVVQCSAIPPARHAEIEERWGVPWFECFGMTETGADIRVDPEEHDELVGTGCLGRPAAHREARLVGSASGGELQLRGPGMMHGYLGHPSPFVDDGWFPTGDLARTDDAGRLYLVGRTKDMIRRSGENVAAREVEDVLLAHPGVRLAAVVGVPDEIRGEEIKAYVVATVSTDELDAWCRERLAAFKVPRYWELRDDLPRTPSERVAKHLLERVP